MASFCGLKLNNNIDFRKKIERYRKVKENLQKALTDQFENYYLPSWSNDALWKRIHDNLQYKWTSRNPYDLYPTPQSFRDWCYEKAEKDKNNDDCNGTWGWCGDCLRNRDWDKGLSLGE
ncbi:hypothetical protein A6V39_05310 [Candidatus Mycoplasma haematobovis]|uniref:Uncharacterized protein n=1 Tax=Candidatus Mycoplasma haematobovis TaxID=432608 RepID=A0A1A9QBB6_9MOLU|nr:hypothetical protein [Candidatus Mycoplasma haematobovis]OAL09753.1 hypothetical protein A6V39_05310 [Candidatus Mycoplasma haematobovis]